MEVIAFVELFEFVEFVEFRVAGYELRVAG